MANTCYVKRSSNGPGYDPGSLMELEMAIMEAVVDELDKVGNGTRGYYLISSALKRAFARVGDNWNNSLLNLICNTIQGLFQESGPFAHMAHFLPSSISNAVSKKYRLVSSHDVNDSSEVFDPEAEEQKQIASTFFIDRVFGTKTALKTEMQYETANNIISSFIIDRKKGVLVLNIEEANKKVRDYKNQLYKNILTYLSKTRPNIDVNQVLFTDQGEYVEIPENIRSLFSELQSRNSDELQKLWESGKKGMDNGKYNAFLSHFILTNFDNLLETLFPGVINIHPEYQGRLKSGDGYSFAEKGIFLRDNWTTKSSEEIDIATQIGHLTQWLVKTTPKLLFNNDNVTEGQYVQPKDFFNLISKIKDLPFKENVYEIIINPLTNTKFAELIKEAPEIEKKNWSLGQLINKARLDSQRYYPLVFKALYIVNDFENYGFSQEDKNIFYSIYKGFFDGEHSVKEIQHKYDSDQNNIYGVFTESIDTLSSARLLQYNEYNGETIVRELHSQSLAKIRRDIENNIYNVNSRRKYKKIFDLVIGKEFNVREVVNEGNGKFFGVTYDVKIGNKTLSITSTLDGKYQLRYGANALNDLQLIDLYEESDFLQFIDKTLGLTISTNYKLKENLFNTYNKSSLALVSDLLRLSSEVFLNRHISNVKLNRTGKSAVMQDLRDIYKEAGLSTENMPRFNNTLFEINLLSNSSIALLENIAIAQSTTYGDFNSIQVQDAEGNMLSTQTLSRLLGNILPQWLSIKDNADSAAKEFSIFKEGFFTGIANMKELKTPFGSKDRTKFTVAEGLLGNFLYEFVSGFTKRNDQAGKLVIGNGIVGLLPSVNSDKGNMGTATFDFNKEVPYNDNRFIINNRRKTYAELTSEDMQILMLREIGGYFNNLYNRISSDFQKLGTTYGVDIDFENGFINFAKVAKQFGGTFNYLQHLVADYNSKHRHDPIHLIDQIHYVKRKNNPEIQPNSTILALMKRFNDIKYMTRFLNLKRSEFLKSMLDENFLVTLTGDQVDDLTQTGKKYLLGEQFKDWVGKYENGQYIDNGKMTLAKIHYQGKTYYITNKHDFLEFNKLIPGVDFLQDPHQMFDGSYQMQVELHPMLDKYNLADYWLTLEFMIAGVGTHCAHPIKKVGKIKNTIDKLIKSGSGTYKSSIVNFVNELPPTPGRTDPVAMRVNRDTKVISVVADLMKEKFQNKTWTNPPMLSDGSQALALPANIFDTFEDFMYFALEHEHQHTLHPQREGETIGQYETRINNHALLEFEKLKYDDDEMLEEALRFAAQHKRNVSYTAAMHEFQLGQIDGIPTWYNMAILPDIKADVYSVSGDGDGNGAKPFDGATYVNPWVMIWENNSLGEAKAGVNKKQFIHFYDEQTGSGGIVKTAGFALTNDLMKQHKFYRIMMLNMTDRQWKNPIDGTDLRLVNKAFLVNYDGKRIDYGKFYLKENGNFIERELVDFDANTQEFIVSDTIVDIDGAPKEAPKTNRIHVKSNFDIYNLFGGWNSYELSQDGTLRLSEKSILLTAKALNEYGFKKDDVTKVKSASDIIQPLKTQDIHYGVTEGAIKQGGANINSVNAYYNVQELNFMRVKMMQAGIQLDKEHSADQGHLSLFTQVISAACARGYSKEKATKLYEMLHNLTKLGTKDFRKEAGKLLGFDFTNSEYDLDIELISQATTAMVMKNILQGSGNQNDMLLNLTMDILNEIKGDIKISKELREKFDAVLPYSNPEIFNKFVTIITSTLTKDGIKIKMPGNLSVLNPAHDIVKLYKVPNGQGGFKYVSYGLVEDEGYDLDELLQLELATNLYLGDIEMGLKYLITRVDGTLYIAHVTMPNDYENKYVGGVTSINGKILEVRKIGYQRLKLLTNLPLIRNANGELVDNPDKILKINNWIKDGNDLQSYNVKFTAGGQRFQIADLSIVQDYFKLKDPDLSLDGKLATLQVFAQEYGKSNELVSRIVSDINSAYNNKKQTSFITHKKEVIDYVLNRFRNGENINVIFNEAANIYTSTNDQNTLNQLKNKIFQFGQGMMNRELQLNLNALSDHSKDTKVKVLDLLGNRVELEVDKSSIDTKAFGIIMPKVFASNFGLDQFDLVEDIKSDPDFFTKKLVKKLSTKVECYYDESGNYISPYHLELKRSDGHHLYIREGVDENNPINSGLVKEIHPPRFTDDKGNVFILYPDNKTIKYQLYSANDKIYIDSEGNEIIVTQPDYFTDKNGNQIYVNPNDVAFTTDDVGEIKYINQKTGDQIWLNSGMLFYLDTLSYMTVGLSKALDVNQFTKLLKKAENSTNKRARKFATRVQNFGKRGKTEFQKIQAMQEFVMALNNYESILENANEKADDSDEVQIKNYAFEQLRELGKEMHTSFLQSLKIVAARIPAQSLQSFMAMEVQGFTNPDRNDAYVSVFLFYLLGSDLDIDAVSLQTFDFDQSGKFVGHSPYYSLENMEMKKVSEKISFPTGYKIPIIEKTSNILEATLLKIKELIGLLNKQNDDNPLILINPRNNDTADVVLNFNHPSLIEDLNKLLSLTTLLNGDDDIETIVSTEFARYLENKYNLTAFTFNALLARSILVKLAKIINDHNLYLSKVGNHTKEKIIKNYLVLQLYDIIVNPINQIQAQSSVDEVVNPAKNLSNQENNPKAKLQNTATPGNVANKQQNINENMVGKDGIAICATGLKSYFALTSLYQIILDGNDKEEMQKLLFDVTIGGKTYHGLANGFTDKFNSHYESTIPYITKAEMNEKFGQDVQDYLIDQLYASDKALGKSGLLSLATDNAKELVLAKINAGTSTIGLYLYGMAIGMEIDQLYDIIASPIGFRIAELTKGNLFEGDEGLGNVKRVLDYLSSDPDAYISKFDKGVDLGEVDILSPSAYFIDSLKEKLNPNNDVNFLNKLIKSRFKNPNAIPLLQETLQKIRQDAMTHVAGSQLTELQKVSYIRAINQIIDFINQYTDDVMLVSSNQFYDNIYGGGNIYYDFEKLVMGAEEYKQIGKILRLNQEIKTDVNDLLDLIANIEECINRRRGQLKAFDIRHGKNKFTTDLPPEVKDIVYSEKEFTIDLNEFVTDTLYQKTLIERYDKIKASFNPLRILATVPQYKGYVETLRTADVDLRTKSIKYRMLRSRIPAFCKKYKILDKKTKQQVMKNGENAFDSYVINDWLLHADESVTRGKVVKKPLTFTIPASTPDRISLAFDDRLDEPSEVKYTRRIILGTPTGNANFKLFMELVLIPELQSKYSNNIFIRDLQSVMNNKTNLGVSSITYGLQINMLPREEWEQNRFDEYKTAFNELDSLPFINDASGKAFNVKDLFYIYGLICTNGKIGPNSLMKIFEDYVNQPGTYGKLKNTHATIFETLTPRAFLEGSSQDDVKRANDKYEKLINDIFPDEALAPSISPYSGKSTIVKYMDSNTGLVLIYKKQEKNIGDEEGYEGDGYDGYDGDPDGEYDNSINGYYPLTDASIPKNASPDFFYNPVAVGESTGVVLNDVEKQRYDTLKDFTVNLANGFISTIIPPSSLNFTAQEISLLNSLVKGIEFGRINIDPNTGKLEYIVDKLLLNDVVDSAIKKIRKECP